MGDGSRFGLTIDYHEEQEALGTVGALASIEGLDDTFLVMNGDVLTTLDFAHLLDVHRTAGNALTIASHQRVVETDYGVLHVEGQAGDTQLVTDFEEKPTLRYTVSMGVYAMEPRVVSFIEPGQRCDLPDLTLTLVRAGEQVGSYPYEGYWLDIGRHDDYTRAVEEFEQMKPELLA
jgi:NDP-sugar pyrophosphorylase family protein